MWVVVLSLRPLVRATAIVADDPARRKGSEGLLVDGFPSVHSVVELTIS